MMQMLELLGDAETPLYSAFRHAQKRASGLSLTEFLRQIDRMIQEDIVRLWLATEVERRRLSLVPADLVSRYESSSDLDDSYDPFGFTLTLGDSAPAFGTSPWTLDVDFSAHNFLWEGEADAFDDAWTKIHLTHPAYEFRVLNRERVGNRLTIRGRVLARETT
jgi:hypothetical protein